MIDLIGPPPGQQRGFVGLPAQRPDSVDAGLTMLTDGTDGLPIAVIAVWFHENLFTTNYSVAEQERIVAHEAYHTVYPNDADADKSGRANKAAHYCFGRSSEQPAWP